MIGVKTSRFPNVMPIFLIGRSGFSKTTSQHNWNRFRSHLIDSPKDNEHQLRHELWNFQQRHRGVLKGLIQSLPDIPYRHKQPDNQVEDNEEKGLESDKCEMEEESKEAVSSIPKLPDLVIQCSKRKLYRFSKSVKKKSKSKYFELRTKVDASTMTITEEEIKKEFEEQMEQPKSKKHFRRKKSKRSEIPKINVSKKTEKVDKAIQNRPIPRLKLRQRQKDENLLKYELESFSDSSSACERTNIPVQSIGHSSQGTTEHSWSTFGMVRKNKASEIKIAADVNEETINEESKDDEENSNDTFQRKATQGNVVTKINEMSHTEADRVWFNKVLGDKDVFDTHHYNEFARARPNKENWEKPVDLKISFGEREDIPGTPPNNQSTYIAKENLNMKITDVSDIVPHNYPGEFNIAPRNPKLDGKCFPTFPNSGQPMKRIGLVQKKIKQAASKALLARVCEGR